MHQQIPQPNTNKSPTYFHTKIGHILKIDSHFVGETYRNPNKISTLDLSAKIFDPFQYISCVTVIIIIYYKLITENQWCDSVYIFLFFCFFNFKVAFVSFPFPPLLQPWKKWWNILTAAIFPSCCWFCFVSCLFFLVRGEGKCGIFKWSNTKLNATVIHK